jgi:hypothetical protein
MEPCESFAADQMPWGWNHYMPSDAASGLDQGTVRDDVGLAIECANLAKEIRAREWAALECFDALMNGVPAGAALADPDKRRASRRAAWIGASARLDLRLPIPARDLVCVMTDLDGGAARANPSPPLRQLPRLLPRSQPFLQARPQGQRRGLRGSDYAATGDRPAIRSR